MNRDKISIILPTYNERENIVPLIGEIKGVLEGRPKQFLVVDDNSPDGTAQFVQEAFPGDPEVDVIVRRADPGLAKSIREGVENATGDLIVVMDTDFNHEPKHLPFMVHALQWYDCVMGSRYLYGGGMRPFSRLFMSWVFNIFVRATTRGKISDNLYGFFAIRRPVLERCDYDEVFWGYGDYFIRLIYSLQRTGATILQVPVMNGERRSGEANSRFFSVFTQYSIATLRLSWRELQRRFRKR